MSAARTPLSPDMAITVYKGQCLIALVGLTMVLLEKQMGLWSVLPAAFGALGLLGNRASAPLLLLLVLCVAVPMHAVGTVPRNIGEIGAFFRRLASGAPSQARRIEPLHDFAACAAILAYVAGQYRLRSLERRVFPQDSRKLGPHDRLRGTETPDKRDPARVTAWEVGLFLATLPIWCGLAALSLFWIVRMSGALVLFPELLRAPLLFLWLVGFVLAVLAAVLGYKGVAEASHEENLLFLQDRVWRETRREQTRIQRWFTWARLRFQRRKEKS